MTNAKSYSFILSLTLSFHNGKIGSLKKYFGGNKMHSITISIPSIEAAKQFVNIASKYTQIYMQIKNSSLSVDPRSIMGILSLELEKPMVLQTDENCPNEFLKDIEPFKITE